MPDDKPLAMIERLDVFRMQTGPMLEGAIDDDDNFPGQFFDLIEGFGKPLGLFFGEALQRIDRNMMMVFQQLRELGFAKATKPCGFFERMLCRHDHEKEKITGTNPLKALTDSDMTCNPGVQGVSHGVEIKPAFNPIVGQHDSST